MPVIGHSVENHQVKISMGQHQWIADEPVPVGDDSGPDPYGLLLSAVAACKIITVQMYAKRKGWDVQDVHITVDYSKVKASECEECVTEGNRKVDLITSKISFAGDLTSEQRQRLAAISERCPVHRTLTSETVVRTTLETYPDG